MVSINFKKYYVFVICFIMAIINLNAQDGTIEKLELKRVLKFEEWKGKNKENINGVNLSDEKISGLSDLSEIKPRNLFFISQLENGKSFVRYRSKWQHSNNDFIEITLSFLDSGNEAQEYLIDQLISSGLPKEIKMNSIDSPAIVGSLSFYQGRIFIRNNIVVDIYAEGALKTKVFEIAKEIDEILLKHKTFYLEGKATPYITIDSNGRKMIIEP